MMGSDFGNVPVFLHRDSFMKQQLEQRLKELRAEYESEQKALAERGKKQISLRSTVLRISNAIRAIGEEIAKESRQKYVT